MSDRGGSPFSIEVTSVPDRDDVVAELWTEGGQLAQLRREAGRFQVHIYPAPTGGVWDLDLDDLVVALAGARSELVPCAATGEQAPRYRCPRCGAAHVEMSEQKVMGRQLFEAHRAACGLGGSWEEDEPGWATER